MAKATVKGWEGIDAKIRQAAARGVLAGAKAVHDEAVSLIENSPATGRTYVRNGVSHIASSPGNPPRSDVGNLVNQTSHEPTNDPLTAIVISRADYASHLEYGTSKMEPRPFLRPALQNKAKEVETIIGNEIAKALK